MHKIFQNEQSNLKPTKIPSKSKKSSVFWHSLGIFWSFSMVLGVYSLFSRIQLYLGHFKSFRGYLVILGAFWQFSKVFEYFGYSWSNLGILAILRGSFLMFWFIYQFFDFLETFTGKIIFLTKKTQEITRISTIIAKSPKYSQKHKMSPKKNPVKTLN